ncbi:MAG: hypothetical protein QXI58_04265 [Candidatus Micrarchaeia archaeon]
MKFDSLTKIVDFLKTTNFSNFSVIEVVKNHYLTEREQKVFSYYLDYIEKKHRQAEIGYFVNMSQPTVSLLLRNCRRKMVIFRNLLLKAPGHIDVIKSVCTPKACLVLDRSLASVSFTKIAKEMKCTIFNVSLICKCALKRLFKMNKKTYYWAYSFLKTLHILRSSPL